MTIYLKDDRKALITSWKLHCSKANVDGGSGKKMYIYKQLRKNITVKCIFRSLYTYPINFG